MEANGRPFIEYLIEGLINCNFDNIHIAAGYRANEVEKLSSKEFLGRPALT